VLILLSVLKVIKISFCPLQESSLSLEKQMAHQMDAIIECLQKRKQELMDFIRKEKEYKLRSLKAEVTSHGQRLGQTTALIQFCIEALKETDPLAFLQVIIILQLVTTRQDNDESTGLLGIFY
jgi:hypothetical protein